MLTTKHARAPNHPSFPVLDALNFEGVGIDENKLLYLKVRYDGHTALLSARNLLRNPKMELGRLEEIGVPLIQSGIQTAFLKLAQYEIAKKPTFDVATKLGLHGNIFVLPNGVVPKDSRIEVHLDESHGDAHRNYHRAGSVDGLNQLFGLMRGNSRLIAGCALALTGPLCAAFGFDPPGLQFVGPGGCGKSSAAAAISSLWGWDCTPGARPGHGFS